MYSGHGCLSVCLSLAAFPHYCTDPDVTSGNDRGCPVVVHYWADLQSVHRFRCYDNIALNAKCQRVLVLALWLVDFVVCSTGLVVTGSLSRHLFTGPDSLELSRLRRGPGVRTDDQATVSLH